MFATLHGRIEAHRARGGTLIPLQIGDTHLMPPDLALRAAAEVEAAELGRYGAVGGMPELGEAVAERLQRKGIAVVAGRGNVFVGSGCTHALFCAARATLDPGDDVLVLSPYWPLIPGVLRTAGLTPIEAPLRSRLDREPGLELRRVFEPLVTARTRAIYIASPNNPDGYVFGPRELQALANFACEYDLWVLADEVYCDFVYEGEAPSIGNLPGMSERTITCHSLSKSHALAGARIGSIAGPTRVIEAALRMSNHTIYNVPVAMQRVAVAALRTGDEWLDRARAEYRRARDAASAELARIGVEHHLPRGGSFIFLDLSARLRTSSLTRLLEL
ncbi:MAG: pyridoxal phosphate-dependent aminotransferase, partial [Myxococcales bacterium]|nr:pyridoxal phosphate-dependent aminotransferase [Myxococcales bacterium]